MEAPATQPPPRVAIVGRPNVGKSTLFNRLVGEDRSVVHDMAGTTRDAIDTLVETPDGPIVFVDTAGMRRRSRIDDSAEYYSLVRALRAIDDADIALLVIDATEGVTSQDQRLAERVDAAGCPIVVMLNKWELIDDPEQRLEVQAELKRKLYFVGDAPVLKISALTGKGVHKLRPVLQDAIEQYHRRVPTRDVNRVIADAQQRQPAGGGARVLYALQGATDPPTFTLFVNRELPQHVPALPRAQHPRGVRASARRRSSCASASGPSSGRAVVRGLRQVLGAVGDERGRHLPDVRADARERRRAEPITAKNLDLASSRPARTARRTPKAPWHFKLLMVLLALYLTWRIVQLFT